VRTPQATTNELFPFYKLSFLAHY